MINRHISTSPDIPTTSFPINSSKTYLHHSKYQAGGMHASPRLDERDLSASRVDHVSSPPRCFEQDLAFHVFVYGKLGKVSCLSRVIAGTSASASYTCSLSSA